MMMMVCNVNLRFKWPTRYAYAAAPIRTWIPCIRKTVQSLQSKNTYRSFDEEFNNKMFSIKYIFKYKPLDLYLTVVNCNLNYCKSWRQTILITCCFGSNLSKLVSLMNQINYKYSAYKKTTIIPFWLVRILHCFLQIPNQINLILDRWVQIWLIGHGTKC